MSAPRDVSFDDYMVQSMKDPAQAAAYIETVIELDDPAALLVALSVLPLEYLSALSLVLRSALS